MAKESQERRKVKETLLHQGDRTLFHESLYLKINRMLADLNRVSRIQGLIGRNEVLYSIQKEGAPPGTFYVVRNAVQADKEPVLDSRDLSLSVS
ncbi:MAG: hypothetical protein LIP08_08385 [Bacteroides sp.]|nr:hypothetical protein [Bacteroides sp.]